MIWQKEECLSRDEMHWLQSKRLIDTVQRVYENVPFYKKKMDDMGLEVGDIKEVEDLSKLPFTTKQDLRDYYPYGLFAVPIKKVVRVHASSGTTGQPTVVGYTKNDPRSMGIKAAPLGAEPWSYEMREKIESEWRMKAYDSYGLSEVIGPGVAFECQQQEHLHINEDHFIPEIVDGTTLMPLEYGEKGELVFTCITKQALPLLRYRTKDISSLVTKPCSCGRTTIRMTKCDGRTDDMLIIRGVNVFPSQIESVLLKLGETAPHYMLIIDRHNNLDTLEVWVEGKEDVTFVDGMRYMKEIEHKITEEIKSVLGLQVKVKLVEPKTIERSEGKAKRIIDHRKK